MRSLRFIPPARHFNGHCCLCLGAARIMFEDTATRELYGNCCVDAVQLADEMIHRTKGYRPPRPEELKTMPK